MTHRLLISIQNTSLQKYPETTKPDFFKVIGVGQYLLLCASVQLNEERQSKK